MAIHVDQGVGGLDGIPQLISVLTEQHASNLEMQRANLDTLTAISQSLLGGTGHQDATRATALTGMTMIGGGSALAGQTLASTLTSSQTRGATPLSGNQLPSTGGAPAANPNSGQTMIPGGSPTPQGAPPASGGGGGLPPGPPAGTPSTNPGGGGGGHPIQGGPSVGSQPSGGLVDSLWNKAKGKVPVLGLADDFKKEFLSQKNKNLWYAKYEGADSASAQFRDRIGEEFSRLRHPLTFDEGESRQAYKQAGAMGYTSNESSSRYSRNDIIDLAATAKNSYGASVDETMRDIDMLGRNGNTNFANFVKNMDELNKIAGTAGVNVAQVADSFRQLVAANSGVYGSAGMQVSRIQAETQTRMGRSMQDFNMSGSTDNTGYQYLMAGSQGMTTGQYNATIMNDPSKAMGIQSGMTRDKMIAFLRSSDPAATDRLLADIRRSSKELSAGGDISDITANQISDNFWGSGPKVDVRSFMQQMHLWSGQTFSDQRQAMVYLIQTIGGVNSQATHQRESNRAGSLDASGRVMGGKDDGKRTGRSSYQAFLQGAINGTMIHGGGQGELDVISAYTNQVQAHGGKNSGAMRDLIHKMNQDNVGDQDVMVMTKDGQRVMKMSEAINAGYGDQIASGRAVFAGGKWQGENLRALGISADSSAIKGAQASTKISSSAGMSAKDYEKAHPGSLTPAKDNHTTTTFDLTADAKKLLQPVQTVADAVGVPRSVSASLVTVMAAANPVTAVAGTIHAIGSLLH